MRQRTPTIDRVNQARRHEIARVGLLVLACIGVATAAASPARPQRIVSLNLCADQLLLALADRDQIAALTQFARDPDMSAAAGQARGLPLIRGSAEEVLARRPDLVLAPPGRTRALIADGPAVAMLDLAPAQTYDEIRVQVRQVARAIGQEARGAALIARMDRELAALPQRAGRGATAAYYQRRGYLTGTGTLIDDLMRRIGLRNLAVRLGKPPLSRVGLEELALSRPDYLIIETATDRVTDQGSEMLHHPLIADIPRLRLPQAWTVCGGPAYVRAAASLTRQLQAGPDDRAIRTSRAPRHRPPGPASRS